MNMKNLLQALNDIEPVKVEDKKRLIHEGAGPGQILNVQMEELDSASLRYLSGVRKTIEECGMAPMSAPMSPSMPKPPASINMTAADANELGSMLKVIASLAGVHEYGKEEPVYRTEPSPVYRDDNSDMKGMVKLIDDGEIEEEIIQDGMNDDTPVYDNSPDRETHGGNFPLEGDVDNSEAANGDVIVDRNNMGIAEQLMAEYRAFVAEETDKEKYERRLLNLKGQLSSLVSPDFTTNIVKKLEKGEDIEDEDYHEVKKEDRTLVMSIVANIRKLLKDKPGSTLNEKRNVKPKVSPKEKVSKENESKILKKKVIENVNTLQKSIISPEIKTTPKPSRSWYVALLNNDRVEGMCVAMALHRVFKLDLQRAILLMRAAHDAGQAMVEGGLTRDLAETKAQEAEGVVRQIHEERGLTYPQGVLTFIADEADLSESTMLKKKLDKSLSASELDESFIKAIDDFVNAQRPTDVILKDKLGQTMYTVSIKSSGNETINIRRAIKELYDQGKRNFKLINLNPGFLGLAPIPLNGLNLSESKFERSILTKVYFQKANLKWVDFTNADLTNADFSYADLRGADFKGAILNGADFKGASLTRKTIATNPKGFKKAKNVSTPMLESKMLKKK